MDEMYNIVVNRHGLRWSNEFGWCVRPFEIYVGLDWDLPHGAGRWEGLPPNEPLDIKATKNVRIGRKTWSLPMVLWFPGGGHYLYNVLDYRKPKAGEIFVSGANPTAYLADSNLTMTYLIVEKAGAAKARTMWLREEE